MWDLPIAWRTQCPWNKVFRTIPNLLMNFIHFPKSAYFLYFWVSESCYGTLLHILFFVSVRVLQRSRNNGVWTYVHVCGAWAEKPQTMWSLCWRCRRVLGTDTALVWAPETQETRVSGSVSRLADFRPKKSWCFSLSPKPGKWLIS